MDKVLAFGNGDSAMVDAEDYHRVARLSWFWTDAGVAANMGGKRVLLHRLIMDAKDGVHIIHLNSNKRDCRRINLQAIEAGYGAIADRDVYGLPSVMPMLEKFTHADESDDRIPRSMQDAIQMRTRLNIEISQLKVLHYEKEPIKRLSKIEAQQWLAEVGAVLAQKKANYARIGRWITQRNLEYQAVNKEKNKISPEEKMRRHAVERSPADWEHLDFSDTAVLMRVAYHVISDAKRRLARYEETTAEQDGIQSHMEVWLYRHGYEWTLDSFLALISEGQLQEIPATDSM